MDTVTLLGHDVTALVPVIQVLLLLLVYRLTGKTNQAGNAALEAATEAYTAREFAGKAAEEVQNGVVERLDSIATEVHSISERVESLERAEDRRRGR